MFGLDKEDRLAGMTLRSTESAGMEEKSGAMFR
jgi:hypothetical protein